MEEDFFSANHSRLLSAATWAKYIAWSVLVAYILSALGLLNQNQAMYMNAGLFQGPSSKFISFLMDHPDYGIKLVIDIFRTVMNGVFYFLVLKGISLGLNMIVETDINYRDKREAEHE